MKVVDLRQREAEDMKREEFYSEPYFLSLYESRKNHLLTNIFFFSCLTLDSLPPFQSTQSYQILSGELSPRRLLYRGSNHSPFFWQQKPNLLEKNPFLILSSCPLSNGFRSRQMTKASLARASHSLISSMDSGMEVWTSPANQHNPHFVGHDEECKDGHTPRLVQQKLTPG